MRTTFFRSVLIVAAIVASAGILAGGLALRPAFAAGGTALVGPFVVVHCFSGSPCQAYSNQGTGSGLQGLNTNVAASGAGILGTATKNGIGVEGEANTGEGVTGTSTSGYGVSGSSTSNFGVIGGSSTSTGVYGTSGSYDGVSGFSAGGYGVYAESYDSDAVVALADEFSGSSPAISAQAGNGGDAIVASSHTGDAIFASSNGAHVAGAFDNLSGDGTDAQGSYIGVIGRAPAGTTTYPLVLTDTSSNDLFYVDGNGDVYYQGSLNTFARTRNGETAVEYGANAASPMDEDTGTGRLVDGVATISLDPAFAQTIDISRPYQVMLTPDGDTRGLYVASKSPTAFVVREVQGGRGTLDFDYHIYAAPMGHTFDRTTVMSNADAAALMPKAAFMARPPAKAVRQPGPRH